MRHVVITLASMAYYLDLKGWSRLDGLMVLSMVRGWLVQPCRVDCISRNIHSVLIGLALMGSSHNNPKITFIISGK